MLQMSFDFALQVEERAKRSKKPHSANGPDELCDFLGCPTRKLCAFHNILGNLSEVRDLADVFDFDDTELLPNQITPLHSQLTRVEPACINQYMSMEVPATPLVRYLRRDASTLNVPPDSIPSKFCECATKITNLTAGQNGKITLRQNDVFWLGDLK